MNVTKRITEGIREKFSDLALQRLDPAVQREVFLFGELPAGYTLGVGAHAGTRSSTRCAMDVPRTSATRPSSSTVKGVVPESRRESACCFIPMLLASADCVRLLRAISARTFAPTRSPCDVIDMRVVLHAGIVIGKPLERVNHSANEIAHTHKTCVDTLSA